jgi:uncharacterized protein (TIGR02594 family)
MPQSEAVKQLQKLLKAMHLYTGPIDGDFSDDVRQSARHATVAAAEPKRVDYPWMNVARVHLGQHEVEDRAALMFWFEKAGGIKIDPSKVPWCGAFVATVMETSAPDEIWPADLKKNPLWARNWLQYGHRVDPTYGAVGVFSRGEVTGHVGFITGQTEGYFAVLGGNQGDAVSTTFVSKGRLLGARWPNSVKDPSRIHLPELRRGAVSTNEQ